MPRRSLSPCSSQVLAQKRVNPRLPGASGLFLDARKSRTLSSSGVQGEYRPDRWNPAVLAVAFGCRSPFASPDGAKALNIWPKSVPQFSQVIQRMQDRCPTIEPATISGADAPRSPGHGTNTAAYRFPRELASMRDAPFSVGVLTKMILRFQNVALAALG